MVEVVCEFLPEESYVGLRESPRGQGSISRTTGRVMRKEDLHDPRRIIREIGFISLTLIIVPPAVLLLFLPRLGPFLGNLRIVGRLRILRTTNLTQWHLASQYLLLDLGPNHFPTTLNAGSGGERSMALKNSFHSCGSLECVDVLSIVLFTVVEDHANRELVGRSGWHSVGPTRKSCRERSITAQGVDVWYTHLAFVLHEFDETVTRGRDKL